MEITRVTAEAAYYQERSEFYAYIGWYDSAANYRAAAYLLRAMPELWESCFEPALDEMLPKGWDLAKALGRIIETRCFWYINQAPPVISMPRVNPGGWAGPLIPHSVYSTPLKTC